MLLTSVIISVWCFYLISAAPNWPKTICYCKITSHMHFCVKSIQMQLQVNASLSRRNIAAPSLKEVQNVNIIAGLCIICTLSLKQSAKEVINMECTTCDSMCRAITEKNDVRPKCHPHDLSHPAAVAFSSLPANQCWETPS